MALEKPSRVTNRKLISDVKRTQCAACKRGGRGDEHPECDAHHIRTRGAGGGDNYWNVIPLCRRCHTKWHAPGPGGLKEFLKKHPDLVTFLHVLGWKFDGYPSHMYHPNETKY